MIEIAYVRNWLGIQVPQPLPQGNPAKSIAYRVRRRAVLRGCPPSRVPWITSAQSLLRPGLTAPARRGALAGPPTATGAKKRCDLCQDTPERLAHSCAIRHRYRDLLVRSPSTADFAPHVLTSPECQEETKSIDPPAHPSRSGVGNRPFGSVAPLELPSRPQSLGRGLLKPQPGPGYLGIFRACSPAPFAGRVTALQGCIPTAAEAVAGRAT